MHLTGLTHTQPALVHVHSEGGDEAKAQIMAEGPSIGVAAQVPTHKTAIHCSVCQHGLSPRIEMMHVHHTAILFQVQEPT